MDLSRIPGLISVNPPGSAAAIRAAADRLAAALPDEYAAFLAEADGLLANHFVLYSAADLPERNDTYEVAEYAPGYVTIGNDNGGRAIVMRGGPGPSPVCLVGHGTMQPADMVAVSPSLADWIAAGCPLRE
ncbi:MAG: SMI1/KNR4 family protein [Gemmataceae bacterium]|nr:SMI1/KNR4 family protein [Gemmataceae bacterium]